MTTGGKPQVDLAMIDRHVDDLVWEQATRTPDAIAAVCDHEQLTYRELAARACQLADELRRRGITGGSLVGLHLDRSLEMLVAILAVLRAGAAYVPLDPDFPDERLRYMVQDSGLPLVLAHGRLVADAPFDGVEIVEVDALPGDLSSPELPTPSPAGGGAGRDLAYVLYTSGSTGRPKGVSLEHRNVVNFLLSMQQEPGLSPDDTLLAVTTLSFDISVLELLLPLVAGGRVIIATRDEATDGDRLLGLIEEHQVNVMQATPSLWRLLIDAGWSGAADFKALCGGEPLPGELANALGNRCTAVWNMYGPTETAVWSTCYRLPAGNAPILIGRAIANTRIYVLDRNDRPAPTGIPGELYIAGAGVARGYLNRPELDAERFLPDPFVGVAGERMYRTGDLGRYLANGNLEFRGRIDSQVKVRGFRIELGEIESVLAGHGGVSSAVVKVIEFKPGDARLVAYVVPADGAQVDGGTLREHLRAALPQYMIPQRFVMLTAFPLLPNGKVDRAGLPPPDSLDDAVEAPSAEPRTETERAIAQIWTRLLGVDRIGVKDNFFDLGGHSLLVAAAVAEIRKLTGVRLEPNRFAFESLEQLAGSIEQPAAGDGSPGLLKRLFG